MKLFTDQFVLRQSHWSLLFRSTPCIQMSGQFKEMQLGRKYGHVCLHYCLKDSSGNLDLRFWWANDIFKTMTLKIVSKDTVFREWEPLLCLHCCRSCTVVSALASQADGPEFDPQSCRDFFLPPLCPPSSNGKLSLFRQSESKATWKGTRHPTTQCRWRRMNVPLTGHFPKVWIRLGLNFICII